MHNLLNVLEMFPLVYRKLRIAEDRHYRGQGLGTEQMLEEVDLNPFADDQEKGSKKPSTPSPVCTQGPAQSQQDHLPPAWILPARDEGL